MDFNVAEYVSLLTVSDSALQLAFKKLSPVQFSCKEKWPQLSDKLIQIVFPFPVTYLGKPGVSSCSLAKVACRDKLNVEASMRT